MTKAYDLLKGSSSYCEFVDTLTSKEMGKAFLNKDCRIWVPYGGASEEEICIDENRRLFYLLEKNAWLGVQEPLLKLKLNIKFSLDAKRKLNISDFLGNIKAVDVKHYYNKDKSSFFIKNWILLKPADYPNLTKAAITDLMSSIKSFDNEMYI